MPANKTANLFEMLSCPSEDLPNFHPLFAELRKDPYCAGRYRYRSYTLYHFTDGRLVRQPSHPLYQSANVNTLWGDVERTFPAASAEAEAAAAHALSRLTAQLLDTWRYDADDVEVGLHPIRTICGDGVGIGHPAPEGFHSDGYLISSIVCVRRENVRGARTFLKRQHDGETVFDGVLREGDFLTFDDHQVFHFTSPIEARDGGHGHRDILLIHLAWRNAFVERDMKA
jgi:histidine decarboxylase